MPDVFVRRKPTKPQTATSEDQPEKYNYIIVTKDFNTKEKVIRGVFETCSDANRQARIYLLEAY